MSAEAPPAPVKMVPYVEPVSIGPSRIASAQDKYEPMRQLPAISRTMTTVEAQQRRMQWQPPNIIPGEFVFYRPSAGGDNNECCAFVLGFSNKTFKLKTFPNNKPHGEKSSVAYYDHTEADPTLTSDPMAPWNNNGTFRRSVFGKLLADMIIAKDGTTLAGIRQELAELQELVKPLLEAKAVHDETVQRLKDKIDSPIATGDIRSAKESATSTKAKSN